MDLLAAPYLAAGLLLVVAGVAKTREPLSLTRALRSAGVPVRAPLLARVVRVLAAVEALVGVAALVHPSLVTAGLVALSYAGFTAFVVRALAAGSPLASCGCFGKVDTPPTPGHATVTALLAVVAALVAARPIEGAPGLPLLAVTAVLAYLLYLALAVLPLVSRRALR